MEGRRREAERHCQQALAIARETGLKYFGPFALAVLASATDDAARRASALAEGEAILQDGAVSHNYFWFYRDAIDLNLALEDWSATDRFADALEQYFRREPTPASDFAVARGRALAGHGRRERDAQLLAKLRHLRDTAERDGVGTALPALEKALVDFDRTGTAIPA